MCGGVYVILKYIIRVLSMGNDKMLKPQWYAYAPAEAHASHQKFSPIWFSFLLVYFRLHSFFPILKFLQDLSSYISGIKASEPNTNSVTSLEPFPPLRKTLIADHYPRTNASNGHLWKFCEWCPMTLLICQWNKLLHSSSKNKIAGTDIGKIVWHKIGLAKRTVWVKSKTEGKPGCGIGSQSYIYRRSLKR